jgi:N-acetylneuraminate synthase
MARTVKIGERLVGDGQPVYIVAEIGINHNGDVDIAKRLIDAAKLAGCDAVKFQKRTPELCVPPEQRNIPRETPWGLISYMEYRYKVEFDYEQYAEIDRYCKQQGITWFASCWDVPSVDFIEQFDPPCYKVASASLTDDELLHRLNATGKPILLSTGMSTMDEIRHAVSMLDRDRLIIMHSTSTYPCPPQELNLRDDTDIEAESLACPLAILDTRWGCKPPMPQWCWGRAWWRRHITLDRAMWGSDQAASVEPGWLHAIGARYPCDRASAGGRYQASVRK